MEILGISCQLTNSGQDNYLIDFGRILYSPVSLLSCKPNPHDLKQQSRLAKLFRYFHIPLQAPIVAAGSNRELLLQRRLLVIILGKIYRKLGIDYGSPFRSLRFKFLCDEREMGIPFFSGH